MRKSYGFSSAVALAGSITMGIVLAVFADWLIVKFAGTDMEMRRIGALCIRLQCIALPIHAWVAVVNMLCNSLGNAGGAFLLATSRQGSCFIPILYPLAHIFGAVGVAAAQAVADVLTLLLAVPIMIFVTRKIKRAEKEG